MSARLGLGASLAAIAALGASTVATAEARPDCILGLICSENPQAAPRPPLPPADCPAIGETDRNPSNQRIEPRLRRALIPPRPDGRIRYGFTDFAPWDDPPRATYAEDMALHKRGGSSILRIGLNWGLVEATRDKYQWDSVNRIYCAVVEAGITPILVIQDSPAWAVNSWMLCSRSPCRRPPKPSLDWELRQFAQLAAIRYPSAVFEAWNEPNLRSFWGSTPNAPRYVEVLSEIYRGVKFGNPSAPVLGGALSGNLTDTPDARSAKAFLELMYDYGAAEHMDGVSFHPSPTYPEVERQHSTRTIDQVQGVLARNGEAGIRHLVATELNASTTGSGDRRFTEAEQSFMLDYVYDYANAQPNLDAIVYYTLIETHEPAKRGMGWVKRKDGRGRFMPKRAYCDFAAEFASPLNCSAPVPVP
jgi:hypothetical protein